MAPWQELGSIAVGAVGTAVLTAATIAILPVVGLLTGAIVGVWIPMWVLVLPVSGSPVLGGAIAGSLGGGARRRAALDGAIASSLGLAMVGAVLGLMALLVMLGMTPAHAQVDLSEAALAMAALGAGGGLAVGAVLGAVGGIGGARVRRESFGR
jgi:hypothetical protein